LIRKNSLIWSSELGKKLYCCLFFWSKVNRSTLTWSMLTDGRCRCVGQTRRPFKVRQVAQAVQGPIKFSRASCNLAGSTFSFSPQL